MKGRNRYVRWVLWCGLNEDIGILVECSDIVLGRAMMSRGRVLSVILNCLKCMPRRTISSIYAGLCHSVSARGRSHGFGVSRKRRTRVERDAGNIIVHTHSSQAGQGPDA